jgi:hypothetical protein
MRFNDPKFPWKKCEIKDCKFDALCNNFCQYHDIIWALQNKNEYIIAAKYLLPDESTKKEIQLKAKELIDRERKTLKRLKIIYAEGKLSKTKDQMSTQETN